MSRGANTALPSQLVRALGLEQASRDTVLLVKTSTVKLDYRLAFDLVTGNGEVNSLCALCFQRPAESCWSILEDEFEVRPSCRGITPVTL